MCTHAHVVPHFRLFSRLRLRTNGAVRSHLGVRTEVHGRTACPLPTCARHAGTCVRYRERCPFPACGNRASRVSLSAGHRASPIAPPCGGRRAHRRALSPPPRALAWPRSPGRPMEAVLAQAARACHSARASAPGRSAGQGCEPCRTCRRRQTRVCRPVRGYSLSLSARPGTLPNCRSGGRHR